MSSQPEGQEGILSGQYREEFEGMTQTERQAELKFFEEALRLLLARRRPQLAIAGVGYVRSWN